MNVDVSNCPSSHSTGNKLGRALWGMVWRLLYRPSPKPFHAWRRFLLRLFGAKIGRGTHHASVKIWAPWNLEMGDHSCLSHEVDCYCVAPVKLGAHVTVSQYSYLCTGATHDIEQADMPLSDRPDCHRRRRMGDGGRVCRAGCDHRRRCGGGSEVQRFQGRGALDGGRGQSRALH